MVSQIASFRHERNLGLLLLLWFCLCGLSCSPPEPLQLGFVGGLSGRVADLGLAGRDAVQLAVDLRNQAGGVAGRQVSLVFRDDRQDPDQARLAVRELLDQDVAAIIGPMTSDMAVAVVPLLNQAHMVGVSPTVTTEALTGQDDFFLRVTATTKVFASANAAYQLKHGRMRRVAAAYDRGNRSFSELWLQNFATALAQGGGEVVAKVPFTSGEQVVYRSLAGRLLASRPDGVLLVANSMDSALLCQQIRKLDAKLPITLADWGANERLLELGGKAVEGVSVVQPFNRYGQEPRYQEFRRQYLDRFSREPGFAGVHGFEAANLVMDALAHAAGGPALKAAILANMPYPGLQGPLHLDQFGDVPRSPLSMSVIRDSRFVVVD
ncbi:MAG: ABC transporter substrate-binding protein [Deltaproteobacteria bacterium]|nr:ABC transporter substrate-binding protein [Deltaproteobacteria bacterium]